MALLVFSGLKALPLLWSRSQEGFGGSTAAEDVMAALQKHGQRPVLPAEAWTKTRAPAQDLPYTAAFNAGEAEENTARFPQPSAFAITCASHFPLDEFSCNREALYLEK